MQEVIDMRATLNIPDDLVSEVQKITKEKSKTKAIVRAMEAYVTERKMTELRALRGKISLDYDWQKEESRELQAQEEREKYLEK
jgi:metal-responsive CopG/Arc/MetJ family transcriptional regulator